MTIARTSIQDFSQANPIYANGVLYFYTIDGFGEKTSTLATIYSSISGVGLLENPQYLDSRGKLRQPVYIAEPVIATVQGLGNVPDHDTGVISGQSSQYVDVVISNAELLDLHNTPKTLIPAQGAGKAIVFERVIGFLDYNSVAYDGIGAAEDIDINYTDKFGITVCSIETFGFIDQTSDTYTVSYPFLSSILIPNAPLVACLPDAILTGNSPIALRIYYNVVDLLPLTTA